MFFFLPDMTNFIVDCYLIFIKVNESELINQKRAKFIFILLISNFPFQPQLKHTTKCEFSIWNLFDTVFIYRFLSVISLVLFYVVMCSTD